MTHNMGTIDRSVRVVLGVIIVGLGFAFRTWWGALGLLPILTGVVGSCPAYLPFRFSTVRGRRSPT